LPGKGVKSEEIRSVEWVKQPVIARMEKGTSDPRLSIMLKILNSLGKTLAVVPIIKEDV